MSSPEVLIAGLREAILAEQAGNDFYAAAAEKTGDPKGREVFLTLAAEEAQHLDYLKEQYGQIIAGRVPTWLLESSGAELGGPSPIFSDQLRARIGEAHWEMTALSVALQLEQASIARYRQLHDASDQPEARAFFDKLVRWEEHHADAVGRQQGSLLESYWHEAHFAPF